MRIDYFGDTTDLIGDMLQGWPPSYIIAPDRIFIPGANATTMTIDGFGFQTSSPSSSTLAQGTVTSVTIDAGGDRLELHDVAWNAPQFISAFLDLQSGDEAALIALYNQSSQITLDAREADPLFEMDNSFFKEITADMRIFASQFEDEIVGGLGNDYILFGNALDGADEFETSAGNDTLDFSTANVGSEDIAYALFYLDDTSGFDINIDGVLNTAQVVKPNGTDTLIDIKRPLDWDTYGLLVFASDNDDTIEIRGGADSWLSIAPAGGNDTIILRPSSWTEIVQINYAWNGTAGPTQGLDVNLTTGVVASDGFGGRDTIDVLSGDRAFRLVEIVASEFSDNLVGSTRNDRFRPLGGDDTIQAGIGDRDLVRYDVNGATDGVEVNLLLGIANGEFLDQGFTHSLSGVEDIWATSHNDTLRGGNAGERLQGLDGNDLIVGGPGKDSLSGGDGNDVLDAREGTIFTEDGGDNVRPGLGADTIWGHQALYENGEGIILSYTNIEDVGGLDVRSGANGSMTVTSGTPGQVNDTATFVHSVYGSNEGDIFVGDAQANASEERAWFGLRGDDTIIGGSGFDILDYFGDTWEDGDAGVEVNMRGAGTGWAIDGFGDRDAFSGIEQVYGTIFDDRMIGANGNDEFQGDDGNDTLDGGGGNDFIDGGVGFDRLIGGAGNDTLYGGDDSDLWRDLIYAGDGNDLAEGGGGNDELNGGNGDDTLDGMTGADRVVGNAGNDVLQGSALADELFGGDGDDYLNGGFGFDRLNGGAGADAFYHAGTAGHGSDWIQDFDAMGGDYLVFGGSAHANVFQINLSETANAGQAGVEEAFVIYRPTGQILWAIVDGGDLDDLTIRAGGQDFTFGI